MAGYVPLPAYRNPENAMLDFSGLNNAVSGFKDAQRQNAMAEYQVGRDKVQDARAGAAASRAAEAFRMEKQDRAIKHIAGMAQMVQQAPPEQQPVLWGKLRSTVPDFDADLQGLGVDPNDHATAAQILIARARGYQDPLATQKAQADIAKTNAEASWYQERPRTMAGGATTAIIDRLMAENPGMSLEQAVTIAKRGSGVTTVGDELVDRNSGAPVRNVAPALAGAESAKAQGEMTGKQTASAPADIQAADNALDLVDKIRKHPGRATGTGASSIGNFIWGTSGYDFQNLVEQAKSGAFLTAIQQMRGLGSLSNAEGQTATQAVTRMNTATTEEGFLAAVDDYEKIVKQGRERAARRMSGAIQPAPPPNDLKAKYGLE